MINRERLTQYEFLIPLYRHDTWFFVPRFHQGYNRIALKYPIFVFRPWS
jgi:hypothetical protein